MSSRITPDGLRISYTALSLWKRGDTQGFLNYINGESFAPTRQMLEGSAMDKKAAVEAMKTKRLIPEFGWFQLTNPQDHLKFSTKMTLPGTDQFVLVGELDIYDKVSTTEGDIYELKTGSWSSANYAKTLQTKIYVLLAVLNGLPVTRVRICHYNQYTNETDVHVVLPSKRMIRSTMKELALLVADIQQFLKSMNMKEGL